MNPLVNRGQRPCILLHCLYIREMNPPGQSITEALHTTTLLIYKGDEPPWSINHRGLAYCYTANIYKGDEPPGQSITEALHTTTLLIYKGDEPLVNQAQRPCIPLHCLYIRKMNPPGQLVTEALHTATLLIYIREMNPLANQAQRPCISLHCLYIYIREM